MDDILESKAVASSEVQSDKSFGNETETIIAIQSKNSLEEKVTGGDELTGKDCSPGEECLRSCSLAVDKQKLSSAVKRNSNDSEAVNLCCDVSFGQKKEVPALKKNVSFKEDTEGRKEDASEGNLPSDIIDNQSVAKGMSMALAKTTPSHKEKMLSMMFDEMHSHEVVSQRIVSTSCKSIKGLKGDKKQKINPSRKSPVHQPRSNGLHVEMESSQLKIKTSIPKKVSKKAAVPRKAVIPRKTALPKKQQAVRKPRSKNTKSSPKEEDDSKLGSNIGYVDVHATTESTKMNNENQPAVSLKIICTPFSHMSTNIVNSDNKSVKENMEILFGEKEKDKKTQARRKRNSVKPKGKVKPPKENSIVYNDDTLNSVVHGEEFKENTVKSGSKTGIKRKRSPGKGLKTNGDQSSPEKKTRGKRKVKKSVDFILDFEDESDNDIELDFSEDEYVPFKEEVSALKDSDTLIEDQKTSVMLLDDEKPVKPSKRTSKKKSDSVNTTKVKEKKTKVKDANQNTESKKSRQKGLSKNKSRGSSEKKKNKEESSQDESLNESTQGMPLLSPSRGRISQKRKKRKIRHPSPKKTFLDDLQHYISDETDPDDPGEFTADEEGEGTTTKKRRKRRRIHGVPYSVTGNWYIASGYLFDITKLLKEFSKLESWRFRDFAICWQKLYFSQIYRGRQNFKELLEFSEEVLLLTKRFLMPPHSTKHQIGALYTLYGLYYKHPFRHFINIRLSRDEYEHILRIVKPFQTDPTNPDPAFIFRKLEVDGAIHHVATSLEMGFEFYCADREAVDIRYESQRLANASVELNSLKLERLDSEDQLLKKYHRTKTIAMGDGFAPERAVAFVEPSTTSDIKEWMIKLKEDTQKILKMKEPPLVLKTMTTESNEISELGHRRAEVVAKAVRIDPNLEYEKRSIIREDKAGVAHKKWKEMPASQCIRRKQTNRHAVDEVDLDSGGVKDIMKDLSMDTLKARVMPTRKSKRKVPHKFIRREINDECSDHEEETVIKRKEISTNVKVEDSSSVSDALEVLNTVPDITPPPKRVRPRARKVALYEALEKPKVPTLTNMQVLREQLKAKTYAEKKFLKNKTSSGYRDSKLNMPVIPVTKLKPPNPQVIEFAPEDGFVTVPFKKEKVINDLYGEDTHTYQNYELYNSGELKSDSQSLQKETFIPLSIRFTGKDVDEYAQFKISASNWNAMELNEQKMDNLKRKLLSTFISDSVKASLSKGNNINVDITPVILKNGDINTTQEDNLVHQLANLQNQRQGPSPCRKPVMKMSSSGDLSGSQALLISPKKENMENTPQLRSKTNNKGREKESVSAVIRELLEIWSPEEGEDEFEIKPVGKGFNISEKSSEKHDFNSSFEESNSVVDTNDGNDVDTHSFADEPVSGVLPYKISGKNLVNQANPLPNTYIFPSVSTAIPHNVTVKKSVAVMPNNPDLIYQESNTANPVLPAVPLHRRSKKSSVSPSLPVMFQTATAFSKSPVITTVSPVYPIQHQTSNMHWVESQPSTSSSPFSPRFPGSISITHVSSRSPFSRGNHETGFTTPVALPCDPSLESAGKLRPLPNATGSKFVKVKINDKSLFVPSDRILTTATKINYISEMKPGTSYSYTERNDQDLQVLVTELNQSSSRNIKPLEHVEVESVVNNCGLDFSASSSSLPSTSSMQRTMQSEVANSSVVTNNAETTAGTAKPNGRVCSFLFSAKYKALSGIMKDSAIGKATGLPIPPKKHNVPFVLKHSLVPRKKSL